MRNSPRYVKKLGRLDGPKSWLGEKFLKPDSQGLKFKRFPSSLALRGRFLPSLERHGRLRVDGDARFDRHADAPWPARVGGAVMGASGTLADAHAREHANTHAEPAAGSRGPLLVSARREALGLWK